MALPWHTGMRFFAFNVGVCMHVIAKGNLVWFLQICFSILVGRSMMTARTLYSENKCFHKRRFCLTIFDELAHICGPTSLSEALCIICSSPPHTQWLQGWYFP